MHIYVQYVIYETFTFTFKCLVDALSLIMYICMCIDFPQNIITTAGRFSFWFSMHVQCHFIEHHRREDKHENMS